MSFLQIQNKNFLITGVSNKKSIATFVAKTLISEGAHCHFTVQNEAQREFVKKEFNQDAFLLNVEDSKSFALLSQWIEDKKTSFAGMVHSIAFANFTGATFHETPREDFLQAAQISCFSLIEISNALKKYFEPTASVVTLSISTTKATSYGYLGPIKAMLNSTVDYLAKSFSPFSQVRFNAVGAGPLKTSASAGIPDYIENYLYSEELTLRKKNLHTQEVANVVSFLLSGASSGMNASVVTVDAGMSANYFDQGIVKKFAQEKL